ncbi:MAG: protein O-mannosyl-transferase family [Syntrophomonadaceae bacterium]
MNNKLVYRITAAVVFVISFVQFLLTAQPSVSFWDCGEFTAAAFSLQVPHPPGAPFFSIIGRIFAMLPIFGSNVGFRVNMVSILSSAFSVMFLFLIAVKLIENIRGKKSANMLDLLTTSLAAAIGALSLSFSDTFWFNGVESEVYASSTFLFASITWLIVVWNDKADEIGNEKYLVMIAYLVGISMGVHLMSVLAVVPVIMVVVFRKYVQDEESLKKTGYIFLAHSAVVLLVAIALWAAQKSTTPPSPEEFKEFDSRFVWTMVGISVLIMGIFWKKIFNRNSIYTALIFGGIGLMVCYPGVVKKIPALPLMFGGNNINMDVLIIAILVALLVGVIYWAVKNNRPTINLAALSMLFVIIGFTSYAMVIIRANQQPPMNENEPNDFPELVSYLNREQYGDFPEFKRRFATEPHQQVVYNNYSSDLDFLWKYQMDHMFHRYLFWNYIGRQGWEQDMDYTWKQLFGIPFLIGLLGIYYHFKKDWKMASVFMVMFIFQGYLTAFYQNQQEPQPRERDYFYVGAFFVFSIWIGLGIRGLVDIIQEKIKSPSAARGLAYTALALGIIFIPFNMARANWFTHDRSKNWIPWDYSYNMLQSCAPNAILFTNGDNDTFPLWYLQDVEGIRRDVRIANLSLLNTPWYIKQLRNTEPYGSPKVAMTLTDQMIDEIQPVRWNPQMISVPVPQDVMQMYSAKDPSIGGVSYIEKYGTADSSIVKSGKLTWRMENTLQYGDVKAIRVQDILVRDIILANNWKRPVYFAVTCSDDSKIGLQNNLIMEGLAFRLVPVKARQNSEFVDEKLMKANLFNQDNGYSKDYKPGFKLRGLNDKGIFFDENHERLTQNYRNSYLRLAVYYIYNEHNKELAAQALDMMEKKMPSDVIKMPYPMMYQTSNLYYAAGAMDKYRKIAGELEQLALKQLEDNPNDVNSYYNPYRVLTDIYANLKEYNKAADIWMRLERMYPQDPSVKSEVQKFRALAAGTKPDSAKLLQ